MQVLGQHMWNKRKDAQKIIFNVAAMDYKNQESVVYCSLIILCRTQSFLWGFLGAFFVLFGVFFCCFLFLRRLYRTATIFQVKKLFITLPTSFHGSVQFNILAVIQLQVGFSFLHLVMWSGSVIIPQGQSLHFALILYTLPCALNFSLFALSDVTHIPSLNSSV